MVYFFRFFHFIDQSGRWVEKSVDSELFFLSLALSNKCALFVHLCVTLFHNRPEGGFSLGDRTLSIIPIHSFPQISVCSRHSWNLKRLIYSIVLYSSNYLNGRPSDFKLRPAHVLLMEQPLDTDRDRKGRNVRVRHSEMELAGYPQDPQSMEAWSKSEYILNGWWLETGMG